MVKPLFIILLSKTVVVLENILLCNIAHIAFNVVVFLAYSTIRYIEGEKKRTYKKIRDIIGIIMTAKPYRPEKIEAENNM